MRPDQRQQFNRINGRGYIKRGPVDSLIPNKDKRKLASAGSVIEENWLALELYKHKNDQKSGKKVDLQSHAIYFIKSLPSWLKLLWKKIKTQNRFKYLTAIILAIVLFNLILWLISRPSSNNSKKATDTKSINEKKNEKLNFVPILPNGKIEDTDSGSLSKFPDREGASYTDKIDNIPITVSQQPLPESMKASPQESVEKLAKDFYATDVIKTNDLTAYLGTSIKGPQTVVMRYGELLLFLQSNQKIDKEKWQEYIGNLK